MPGAGFHIFLPTPVAIESNSVLCLLTSFMLYFGQLFSALANNTDSDLFCNSPFSSSPPIAKNKNGCKARFILNSIFYLSTSLDALWRNPGLGSLKLHFSCWKTLVLQHPQLLPTNCCCPLGVQGGLLGGGSEGWADLRVG